MFLRRIWLPPLVSALAAFGFFLAAMAYPWQLAVLAATAIGAFVYSTQITWQRMRRLARPPEEPGLPPGDAGDGEARD